jgi:hypothetical protein
MHRLLLSLLVGSMILAAQAASLAAEKALPEGLSKSVAGLLPPDFAGFPAGTDKVEVSFLCKRDADVFRVEWEFERESRGPLALKGMGVERIKEPPEGMCFPEKTPAESPSEALKASLLAMQERSIEKLRPYVDPEEAKGLEAGGPELFKKMEEKLAKEGVSIDAVVKNYLARALALPPRCNKLALEYSFPGRSNGNDGAFVIEATWILPSEGAAHWTIGDFHPRWKDKQIAPAAGDAVAPEGLRRLIAETPLPDVGGFPAGTDHATFECLFGKDGKVASVEVGFRTAKENGPLVIKEIEIRSEDGLPEGLKSPAIPPAEGPLDSLRGALACFKTLDKEKVIRYVPAKDREEFEKDFDKTIQELKALLEKQKEEKGYDSAEVALANLPSILTVPAGAAKCKLSFSFPMEVRGQKGSFRINAEMIIDDPGLDHWVVGDLDMNFDKAETEEPEEPGEEKGKEGE